MKEFRDFESARDFASSLGLKSKKAWLEYAKSGNKPDDIPASPENTYKKDFNGVGDWLGTGRIANRDKQYRPFQEARDFAISLNLKGLKEWTEYGKSGNKPDNIPSSPHVIYKNKGWKGHGDWLGTGIIAPQLKKYRPFTEAREFVRKLELKGTKEWTEYYKSGNKPDDIPTTPWNTYKNYFKGMGDWLGNGIIATNQIQYRPYKDAREFVRTLGLKGHKEWLEYCASGNKPNDIPSHPWKTYKEWKKK